ncbi:MAG: DUF1499 domain-containing protein [Sedimentitalea sp.]
MLLFWIILAIAVGFTIYVRAAPSQVERWHVPLTFSEDKTFKRGVQRVVRGDLAALDHIIMASGAMVLDGSVEDGHVTYISRSKVVGFPDYTTVVEEDGTLRIYARLRFGRSDLGVNRARVDRWIDALQAR